jgi:hypothetical protein
VLAYFNERVGQIVTRDQLHDEFLAYPYDGESRAVDALMSRLRRLAGAKIRSVRGEGYILDSSKYAIAEYCFSRFDGSDISDIDILILAESIAEVVEAKGFIVGGGIS